MQNIWDWDTHHIERYSPVCKREDKVYDEQINVSFTRDLSDATLTKMKYKIHRRKNEYKTVEIVKMTDK